MNQNKEKTTSEYQKTLKDLKKKDVFYLKADKSNSVVAVDRLDYIRRMEDLISDGPYIEINFNPLDKMIKAVKATLNTIKMKFNIELEGKWTVSNPKVPRIYGAPKTHKPGNKMRPITSNIDAPSEIAAKRLVKQFKEFQGPPGFYVENTLDAIKKLENIQIEDDECMVSFDVTALFPNVPIEDALLLLKKWLKQNITDMDSVNTYVELAKMCMQDNYFQFDGRFYQQTFGTSMGNALSPFLANIFMADLESRLSKLKIFPKIWIRYVDDIFCVMKKNTIERMLVIMNRRHNTIKFTHEVEENGTLSFLDTKITRIDKKLNFNIYRKPMATSRFIPIDSHHSIQHKSAAFNSMIHRLINTPLSTKDAMTELNEIRAIAKINGYSEKFVDRIHKKHKKKKELRTLTTLTPTSRNDTPNKRHAITFYPTITNKLQRIFRNHQIDLVYSNKGKLKDILGNPKDKHETTEKSGIYQVNCTGCDYVYIGQTKRCLKTRFVEHHSNIRLNHPDKSNIARHVLNKISDNQGHGISLNHLTLVKEVRKQNELDAYESFYISRRKKEGANLMNVAAGKITSQLFELVP
jgi:Reverse transcriptase (RNA-dependent DNA polymerase)